MIIYIYQVMLIRKSCREKKKPCNNIDDNSMLLDSRGRAARTHGESPAVEQNRFYQQPALLFDSSIRITDLCFLYVIYIYLEKISIFLKFKL